MQHLTLAALSWAVLLWGPVQFRISEAVVVIALFTADAIPGPTLAGCQPCKIWSFLAQELWDC